MSTVIVVLIVSGAVWYVGSQLWKAFASARKRGCDSDCGCGH